MDDSQDRSLLLLEEYFPGSLIGGKYRLEAVIGRGGMGTVWRATNVVLEMPVAVKLIHPEVRGGETTALLLNEARLAAKLQHPSIVRLFDFGVAKTGDAYIVMELLNGSNLAVVLERHGKLPAITAVRWLLPIVHALSAAHHKGIVHLDLKPENIVISKAGDRWQPKLLDFGIAKKTGLGNNSAASEILLGSPAYMSPEYACGNPDIDAGSDIWGICVVLYELVSGRSPFTAATVGETMRAILGSEPEPLADEQAGAPELWKILRTGLAKDRQQRFANARQLGEALAQWLVERDQHDDVCGEPLVSNWGPSARARADLSQQAQNETIVARTLPKSRWRSAWLGAAVGLGLVVSVFALWPVESGEYGPKKTTAGRTVEQASRPTQPTDSSASATPQLTASKPYAETDEVKTVARSPAGVATRPSSAPARQPRLTGKVSNRARSREATLGLKDPFE